MNVELTKPTLVRSMDEMNIVPQPISEAFMTNYAHMGNFQTIPPPPIARVIRDEDIEKKEMLKPYINLSLIDDTFWGQFEPSNIFSVLKFVVEEIKKIDKNRTQSYFLRIEPYCSGAYVTFSKDNDVTGVDDRAISTLSFSVTQEKNMENSEQVIRLYVNSLFLNSKYINLGSKILSILKEAVKMLVNLENATYGCIELYSVETAVLFYLKNDFVIKQLLNKTDPQAVVSNVYRVIEFAMKENNIELVKKFATIDNTNFMDFIDYMLNETTYGKFYSAYFDALPNGEKIEKNVFQSKFISSLFSTNMIQFFKEVPVQKKIEVKILTY